MTNEEKLREVFPRTIYLLISHINSWIDTMRFILNITN